MKQSKITLYRHWIVLLGTLSLHLTQASSSYEAIVIVPVADLVGAPIKTFFPMSSPEQAYHDLVICGGKPAMHSCCPRLHQVLFNEKVTAAYKVAISVSTALLTAKAPTTAAAATLKIFFAQRLEEIR